MPGVVGDFLSWIVVGLPAFLFVITVVVFFHELGHFLMARSCGVAVEAFSIGFGRELIGWTDRKGTRWRVSLLPLGGYVKFAGDTDVSSRPDDEALRALDNDARARVLHFKPIYQRALVAAAGPFANFLLAVVILTGLFMTMPQPVEPPVISEVTAGSAAEAAGLRAGDTIVAVGGKKISHYAELQELVGSNVGRALRIAIERDGAPLEILATPRLTEIKDAAGNVHKIGLLGIKDRFEPLGPFSAFARATSTTVGMIAQTLTYLAQLVAGHASTDQLSGPAGIAKASGDVASMGFLALLKFTAYISVAIGFANLLPIPVLDGGHLLYYAFEAVLGRPLGERAQEVGFRLGLAFVLCLMLLATFNDLIRFNLF